MLTKHELLRFVPCRNDDYEFGDESGQPKASSEAVGIDIAEILKHEKTINRLKSLRVPVLLIRAEMRMEPSKPPILPDSVLEQFQTCVPEMKEETISGTTHFTIMLGERGASRVADLIVEFADSCEKSKLGEEQKQK